MTTDHSTSRADIFASTHWSIVSGAGSGDPERAVAALENLCRAYWQPLYVYVRHKGYSPEDAEDLTQEFFTQLLQSRAFHGLDRSKGRFRAYLLVCLKHFLSNAYDRAHTRRRGGGQRLLPLDVIDIESRIASSTALAEVPDKAYDRQWATLVLERALARLRSEFVNQGKAVLFDALKPALAGDHLDEPYAAIADRFGMKANALKVTIHRLRRRYRDLLRAEIAGTVSTPEAVEDETRQLLSALS